MSLSLLFLLISCCYGAEKLSQYNADPSETTISGLSSGAFFATQLHVAYSASIKGAGIVAGGPYDCAAQMSYTSCMYSSSPSVTKSISNTKAWSGNKIDDIKSPTWRAHSDWMEKLNYSDEDMINLNQKSIELIEEVRKEYEKEDLPIVLNASIGPRGDGYNPTIRMTPEQAFTYHSKQIEILSKTNVDMITALTFTYPDEAIGIVQAAKHFHLPIVVSFTLETDGKLPTGQTVKEAIEMVDQATNNTPSYYMINCAHPTVMKNISSSHHEDWTHRIHGIKGNASKKSHQELDQSKQLDDGNPIEFAQDIEQLLYKFKYLNILGGCCGTDHRHLQQTCLTSIPLFHQKK